MKKLIFLLLIIPVSIYAQRGTASIKMGYFDPSAANGGFIIGFEGGRAIDQGFSFGWSIDWYHKNYIDKSLVQDFNQYDQIASGSVNELRAETNLHDFPLMATMAFNFPVAPFSKIYITGGIGAEMLIIDYNNFQNPDQSDLHAAFDFSWRIGTGMIYEVGPRTDFLVELTYHSSEPSWNYEVEDQNRGTKRTFERSFDMSGLMIRAGVKFYY